MVMFGDPKKTINSGINDLDENESPVKYKEKKWGKEEGGEFITDGFVFRGGQAFKTVLDELKGTLKKGLQQDIGEIHWMSERKVLVLKLRLKYVIMVTEVLPISNFMVQIVRRKMW